MANQKQTIEIRDTAQHEGDPQTFGSNSAAILKIINDLDQDVTIEIETQTFDDKELTFVEAVSFTTKVIATGTIEYIPVVGPWSYTRALATAAGIPTTGDLTLVWDFTKSPVNPDILTEADKGIPDGVCPLDSSAYVPLIHIPPAVLDHMDFKGPWDASGGTMPVSPDNGDTYRISVAGTLPVVGYAEIGDLLIYSTDDLAWTLYQTNMTIGDQAGNVQENGAALNATEIVETDGAKKFITAAKGTAYNKAFGSTSGTVCEGDDARLSDARVPLAHKDSHDPEDGSDPLDTDAPGAINETANAEGTAHSFARSDHNHQHLASLHENGGGAEISVAGLSGVLADDQHVIDAEVQALIDAYAAKAKSGKKYYVSDSAGSDIAPNNGTEQLPLQNLQSAIDAGVAAGLTTFSVEIDIDNYSTQGTGTITIPAGVTVAISCASASYTNANIGNVTLGAGSGVYLNDVFVGVITATSGVVVCEEVYISQAHAISGTTLFFSQASIFLGAAVPPTGWTGTYLKGGKLYTNGIDGGGMVGTNFDDPASGTDAMNKQTHDADFDITTGHDHDGANSKQVDGSDVINTPAGDIAATNVQDAIDELDTEKVNQSDVDSSISTHTAIAGAHHARPVQATETTLGIAEIATQAETDAGTDDLRTVTPLKLKNSMPVFGTEYDYAESEAVSSTSLTAYQQKLKLTTAVLPAGDYHIEWSCEVANSSKDKRVEVKLELDDTTVISEIMKPKVDGDNEYLGMAGTKEITLTNATHTLDIDYRALANTAYIRRARITIWRVA